MDPFAIGVFLAVVNQKIIDYLLAPFRPLPEPIAKYVIYLALVTGAVLTWVVKVNMFETYIADELVGRVLTCILVGGGSSLIHDIFDPENKE